MSSSNPRSGGRSKSSRRGGRQDKAKQSPPVEPLHPIETPPDIKSFREFDLCEEVLASIEAADIFKPTPIQALTIGAVLEGRDVIAKAETGTGKTLAFGAPMMSQINPRRASVLGLVLSPTRELAEQVYKVLAELGKGRGVQVAFVVGGEPIQPQIQALKSGAQVVVGTPGRVLDLMGQRFLSFPWTEFAVLDEADKMLEIGFLEDIRNILKAVAPEAQKLMFSATFPADLLHLARQHTHDPLEVATASGFSTVDTIRQCFIRADEDKAFRHLAKIIEKSSDDDTFIVFCHRRTDVNRLMRRMERLRFAAKALHGGYEQDARFLVMEAFRRGDVKALVATDVASRGLDIKHVTHVVNYGAPRDMSDYTHRIGRTGRAGREGTAVTIVFPQEERNWRSILKSANWTIEELQAPLDLYRPRAEKPADSKRADSERADKPADSRRADKPADSRRADKPADSRRAEKPADSRRDDSRRTEKPGDSRRDDSRRDDARSDAERVDADASDTEASDSATSQAQSGEGGGEGGDRPRRKRRRSRRRRSSGDAGAGREQRAESNGDAREGSEASKAGDGAAASGEAPAEASGEAAADGGAPRKKRRRRRPRRRSSEGAGTTKKPDSD